MHGLTEDCRLSRVSDLSFLPLIKAQAVDLRATINCSRLPLLKYCVWGAQAETQQRRSAAAEAVQERALRDANAAAARASAEADSLAMRLSEAQALTARTSAEHAAELANLTSTHKELEVCRAMLSIA